jgi:hypothetical protein
LAGRHHRTTLRPLDRLARLRPRTLAVLTFATVVLGGMLGTVVLNAVGGHGAGQPALAAPPVPSTSDIRSTLAPPPVASSMPASPSPAPESSAPASTASRSPVAPSATRTPVSPQAPPTSAAPAPTGSPTAQAARSYEAESQANTVAGGAAAAACPSCSGGQAVRWIGYRGTLQFNGLVTASAGMARLTFRYLNGDATRSALLSVDGGGAVRVSFPNTGGWNTVGSVTVTVRLTQGANRLKLSNNWAWAPDFDKITLW